MTFIVSNSLGYKYPGQAMGGKTVQAETETYAKSYSLLLGLFFPYIIQVIQRPNSPLSLKQHVLSIPTLTYTKLKGILSNSPCRKLYGRTDHICYFHRSIPKA